MNDKRKVTKLIESNKGIALCVFWVLSSFVLLEFSCGQIRIEPLVNADEEVASSQWLEGATLKTDSEVDELMARAEQFSKQGRYDLASSLWQIVIDSSNDLVFSNEEWVERTLSHRYELYRSVSGEIENALSALPAEGLKGYRVNADADANEVLSSYVDEDREKALAEVVRRYFLSSFGDDAAFELACFKLDRYEFLPAIRLLEKIIDDYPDSNVNRSEVILRIAALNARVGDVQKSLRLIEELKSDEDSLLPKDLIRMVEEDIARIDPLKINRNVSDKAWPMILGGASRSGVMRVPVIVPSEKGGAMWVQNYELTVPDGWPELPTDKPKAALGDMTDPFARRNLFGPTATNGKLTNDQILSSWKKYGWRPSSQLLFDSGYIYFKNDDRLVCADSESGELKWLGFRNEYPQPNFTKNYRFRRPANAANAERIPREVKEVQYFSDHVNQSMSIVGNKIITIQGLPVDFVEEGIANAEVPDPVAGRAVIRNPATTGPPRMRKNRLVAYHSRNGKLQWMRSAVEPGADIIKSSCFIGPPVPYANLLLVPILEESGIYLVAINPDSGVTQWRTFLGDEPESGVASHSLVMIAVDGGEAYMVTGSGLVFSLDAISGSLNWVVRYPRTAKNNAARMQQLQRFGGFARGMNVYNEFDGWGIDTIITAPNALIVAPSDFNQLMAFDRRTGKLLWESARSPGNAGQEGAYILGALDDSLYVAGTDVLRCYNVKGGKMLWETIFPKGYGRGALTADGIYVPSGFDKVIKFSLNDGEQLDELAVVLSDKQPVGNLFSNGKRLYTLSLRRLSSIGEVSIELQSNLEKKSDTNKEN